MATHTPGPWEFRSGRRIYILAGDVLIGTITSDPSGSRDQEQTDEANARLIASAPDLLAALRELVEAFDSADGKGLLEAIAHARATIDEATKT